MNFWKRSWKRDDEGASMESRRWSRIVGDMSMEARRWKRVEGGALKEARRWKRVDGGASMEARRWRRVDGGASMEARRRRNRWGNVDKGSSPKKRCRKVRRRRNAVVGMTSKELRRRHVTVRSSLEERRRGNFVGKASSKEWLHRKPEVVSLNWTQSGKEGSSGLWYILEEGECWFSLRFSRYHSYILVTTLTFSLSRRNAFAPPSLSNGPIRALGAF